MCLFYFIVRLFDHVSRISTGDTYDGISFAERTNKSKPTKDTCYLGNYGKCVKIELPAALQTRLPHEIILFPKLLKFSFLLGQFSKTALCNCLLQSETIDKRQFC